MFLQRTLYAPVGSGRSSEDDESIDEKSSQEDYSENELRSDNIEKHSTFQERWTPSPLLAALLLLIVLAATGCIVVGLHEPSQAECTRQLNTYSPALEAIEYIDVDFDADFNSSNIYRGLPTSEREAAWDALTYQNGIEVPVDKLYLLNRTEADDMRHVPADVGAGYVGILEVFHQLHCLNMIRTYTWFQVNKYLPGKTPAGLSGDELKDRMHVDHCIESLRISLQCWGDVTPLLIRLGGSAGAKADFNTHHRCRDFSKIEAWLAENFAVE